MQPRTLTIVDVARAHGISQVELASCLRVSEMAVSQWAHHKTRPRPELVLQFSLFVGMTPDELQRLLGQYPADIAYYHMELYRSRVRVCPDEFANVIHRAKVEALHGDANYARMLASGAIAALEKFRPRPGVETSRTNELLMRALDARFCTYNRALQETDALADIEAMKTRLALWRSLEDVPDYYLGLPLHSEAKLDYTMAPYELEHQPNRAMWRAQRGIERTIEYLEHYGDSGCSLEYRLRLLRQLCLLYGVVKNEAGFRDECQRALRTARTHRAEALAPACVVLTLDARVRGLLLLGEPSETLHGILQAQAALQNLIRSPTHTGGAAASLAHTMLINAVWHWDYVCRKLGEKTADSHILEGIRTAQQHAHICKLLHAAFLLQRKFGDGHRELSVRLRSAAVRL